MTRCNEALLRQLRVGIGAGLANEFAWEQEMKKVLMVAAAAGLMSLAACNSQQAEQNESNAEMMADNIEAQADNLEDQADAATNDVAEEALENAADNAEAAAANVEENADNETDLPN
ncbi:hypothetical protein [Sphingomonas guangdongensis]|nr:hypothetical protein [Sphingomonas guangdongensis]